MIITVHSVWMLGWKQEFHTMASLEAKTGTNSNCLQWKCIYLYFLFVFRSFEIIWKNIVCRFVCFAGKWHRSMTIQDVRCSTRWRTRNDNKSYTKGQLMSTLFHFLRSTALRTMYPDWCAATLEEAEQELARQVQPRHVKNIYYDLLWYIYICSMKYSKYS